jgi:hypothetical protein
MNNVRKLMAAAVASAALCVGSQASTYQQLGNYVWYDVNEDGLQDGTDVPAPGVVVWLYEWDPAANGGLGAGVQTLQTTTNKKGEYYFFVQSGKQYYVQFFPPDGFGFTTVDAGLDEAVDSDAYPDGVTALTSVFQNGEVDYDWDAGLVETAGGDETYLLGDYVWYDLNRNGIQDEGPEWGVEGVTVKLYAAADRKTVLDTTETDATGLYSFSSLVNPALQAGTWVVRFVLPAGYAFTTANQGSDDQDSDAGTRGFSGAATLTAVDSSDDTLDAGIYLVDACTRTLGYWKTHPEAWPVESITVGGVTYTKDAAIAWMKTPPKGDESISMFHQLVAAKLNVFVGNNSSCIAEVIEAADAWLIQNPIGSNGKCGGGGWTGGGGALHQQLDDYNNGKLCAPHCDDNGGCDWDWDCDWDWNWGCDKDWDWDCDKDRDWDCDKDRDCSKDRGHRGRCDNDRNSSGRCGR